MQAVRYSKMFRRHVVLLGILLLAAIAVPLTAEIAQPKQYTSSSSVYVSISRADSINELALAGGYAKTVVTSYATVATSPVVLGPVIRDLGLNETAGTLATKVTATVVEDTAVVNITATASSPTVSEAIANGVADQLASTVDVLDPVVTNREGAIKLSLIGPAVRGTAADAGVLGTRLAISAVVALAVWLVISILHEVLQRSLRDEDDIADVVATRLLFTVPTGGGSDRYLTLARRIQTELHDRRPVLALLPVGPGDTEEVAGVLAGTLAQLVPGRVLVAQVVADATGSGLPEEPTLVSAAVAELRIPAASISGDADRARAWIAELAADYDFVLVSVGPGTAPSLSDAVSSVVSASILVCAARTSSKDQLASIATSLAGLRAEVIGVLLVAGRRPRSQASDHSPVADHAPDRVTA